LNPGGIGIVLRVLISSLLLGTLAPAQIPAPTALIDRLVANADRYRATLPSLTADESIVTEGSAFFFHQRTTATGTFRVIRRGEGQPLEESRQILMLNGKPVEPGKHVAVPFTLLGGFGRFQEMFFTPQHRICFTFTLLPKPGPGGTQQIAIAGPDELSAQPGCAPERKGLTGLALVDPASGQLVHLERTVTEEASKKDKLAPFASVDSAPTQVGDQTYWLPTVIVGRFREGKVKGEFIAHYSNYHRYTASITLLPGATEVDPATPPPPLSSGCPISNGFIV
jgi:hypothetical protein